MTFSDTPGDGPSDSPVSHETTDSSQAAKSVTSDSDAASQSGTSRKAGIALAALLVGAPIVFFVLHSSGNSKVVSAQQPPAAANVASLEAAVNASPTSANRINLSLAYINSGASARAIQVLQSVVAQDKNNAIAWNDLCVAHTLQQDYASALDECNQALAIDPSFQLARNNLKWASDEKNKTLAAINAASQSTAVRDVDFFLKQGMNQLHVGDYDQAIVSWQQMLHLDPKNAMAANNIGTAYMLKRQPDVASGWFDRALKLDPNLQIAKNNLAWAHQELQNAGR